MTIRAPADAASIARAAEILREGGLVAFPTETVYGLGADATSAWAVARIYDAKGRPSFNPLIAHVADLDAARREAVLPEAAIRLAEAFWPGPLTIVAPAAPGGSVCELARAGLPSVALRIPDHSVARALIAALGRPIAAPSANRSGHVSPVTAAHVAEDLSGRVDMILDGGRTVAGLESTIVSFCDAEPALLRPGAARREKIEKILGRKLSAPARADITAPGMTASHYAPKARLRLEAHEVLAGESALDFGGRLSALAPAGTLVRDLSPKGDLVEAAANLFAYLRELDALGAEKIAVAHMPERGLGEAINDRLRRAAAPRVG
ncbi:L-threonylcarbamoyladenylate synthase [Methylocystis parvus]|uniref:Threonylcarbamoyl-AMP synthase n=1 Tax=Methylocystis parvus TaxID=134 RepID=A0A6B8LUY8_9HYPH|nr:L-threonylcarbamoyladenylate synthase [Methylocystis parvus]QGM96177.1 threonylcarbamoyl-AMP synthase [Methylocystis parvus]WBJ99997.1 threonylcarbamoyl-AMP synthase [Methylocystis parvus OBBP]